MPLISCQCLNKRVELSDMSKPLETLCKYMFDTISVEKEKVYCMHDDAVRTSVTEMLKSTYEQNFQSAEWQRLLLKRVKILSGDQLRNYIYNLYMRSIGLSIRSIKTFRRS